MRETPQSNSVAAEREVEGRLRQVVAQTFGLRIDNVNNSTSSATVRAWDSIGQMELVLALEQEFGLSFTPEDILLMDRLEAIHSLLRDRGIR